MPQSSLLIEGIGGIGGVMAARLIQAGYTPTLVTHNPAITEAINRDGLRLIAPGGSEEIIPAQAVTTLDEAAESGPFDTAYLIMKADGVVAAARQTVPLLTPKGYVVTFQNGIVEDAVAEAIGADRVVSGIIGWGGTMHAPGVYEQTSPGQTHIGELDGRLSDRVRALSAVLEAVTPVIISRNIRGALWSKLAINCTINSPGVITGQTLGEMLRDRHVRRLFLHIYREVVDTATAHGIRLERVAANPHLLYLPPDAGPLTVLLKDLITRFVGYKYRRIKSSSLQSLERGRKTEIDYLNGYVVAQAQAVGLDVPVNAALVRMVKEIEAGERPIAPLNMRDLLAEVRG